MRLTTSLLFICLTGLTSCHFGMGERISGNGHIIKENRSVSNFNRVHVSGSMNVRIRQDANREVNVEADENLMSYIEVFTEGEELVVRSKRGYNLNPTRDIIVTVTSPSYSFIHVSGSGDVIGENSISGNDRLETDLSGSGNMKLKVNVPSLKSSVSGSGTVGFSGESKDFDLSISGSGNANCFDLVSDNVSISLSGSSDANVTANRKLDISVSGSGNVKYKGNASVSQRVSGSGDVKKVD
jgi:hypothetical protein